MNKKIVLIIISFTFLAFSCGKKEAKSPEELGQKVIETLKSKSANDYLVLTRNKSDWNEIFSNSTLSSSEKKDQKKAKADKIKNEEEYKTEVFNDLIAKGEEMGINWDSINYESISKTYEETTAGIVEEEYEVTFTCIGRTYVVTLLGCLETKRGWVTNTLYTKILDTTPDNSSEEYPLHQAAFDGDLEKVKELVENGANIYEKDNKGMTPVMSATLFVPHLDVVQYLESKGADLKAKDSDGNTLLHNVIISGDLEIIKYLVEYGLDVNAANNDGLTPFQIAIVLEQSNPDVTGVVAYLESQGAK